jgi:CubicO group peptidase (beta-lactamase class C family)
MNKAATLIFIILAALISFCSSDDKNSFQEEEQFEQIENLISSAIADKVFPGSVLLIYKDDEIIYQSGFGYFTYDSSFQKVDENTIYDIASLTKVIATTTAAMLCIDKNLFSLDDPVDKYVSEFSAVNKNNITIKNLLLHNSGLPAWKKYYHKNLSEKEIINDIYSTNLVYKPETNTLYSDLGMIILALVIESATNKNFDEFCNEEIFSPLKMNNTFFNPPDSIKYRVTPTEIDDYWRNRLIWGEVHDETASLLNGVAGHAGLFSTAEDICKLLQMFLNGGKINNNRFIREETIILFTKRYSDKSSRALGWDTKSETGSSAGNLFSPDSYGHTGFTGTSIWVDPTKNLFVVFLSNRVYPSRDNKKIIEFRPKLHDAIIEALY